MLEWDGWFVDGIDGLDWGWAGGVAAGRKNTKGKKDLCIKPNFLLLVEYIYGFTASYYLRPTLFVMMHEIFAGLGYVFQTATAVFSHSFFYSNANNL